MVADLAPQPAEIGDPGVGEDHLTAAVAAGEIDEHRSERPDSQAGVDDHWHARLGRDRQQRDDAWVIEAELLGARMQLQPTGARVQCIASVDLWARCSRVDARERHQPIRMAPALLDHTLVLRPVAGRHAEREDNRPAVDPLEVVDVLLARPGRAVDVEPGVGVDVEDPAERSTMRVELRPDHRPEPTGIGSHRAIFLTGSPARVRVAP